MGIFFNRTMTNNLSNSDQTIDVVYEVISTYAFSGVTYHYETEIVNITKLTELINLCNHKITSFLKKRFYWIDYIKYVLRTDNFGGFVTLTLKIIVPNTDFCLRLSTDPFNPEFIKLKECVSPLIRSCLQIKHEPVIVFESFMS